MGKSGFKIERAAGGENTLYHDVAEVFRVYRQVTWQMQAKIHQVKARFHREYGPGRFSYRISCVPVPFASLMLGPDISSGRHGPFHWAGYPPAEYWHLP